MVQKQFAEQVTNIVTTDNSVVGLAVAGSWITAEIDEFSDLDLILVTKEKVSNDKNSMFAYAEKFGNFLSGFTGEHVGEPRVLICLYDNPLLHVDIKFLTLEEFGKRIETPVILFDRDGQLQHILAQTEAIYPQPDFQWIEDRFWIWVHYALLKIGRGEYFEAFDFFSYLRMVVLGPLLHLKNGKLPRGVRKVETELQGEDIEQLKLTLASYDRRSLIHALENTIMLYDNLRNGLFPTGILLQKTTEDNVKDYLQEIKMRQFSK